MAILRESTVINGSLTVSGDIIWGGVNLNDKFTQKVYSPANNLNFHKIGQIVYIESGEFVRCDEIYEYKLKDEYIPYSTSISIPCTYIDESYEVYNGILELNNGIAKVKCNTYKNTGWFRVNGSYPAKK